VDIDEKTDNIDIIKLENEIKKRKRENDRLKAIVPVHLYGQLADMDPILEIAKKYGLVVIEDACQAHGAEYVKNGKVRKAGSMSLAGCFSFYPGKNLGSCGEGGAVVTNNEILSQKIKMYRDHGQSQKYYHEFEGYNGRMHAIQAGILRIKLNHISVWNEKRRKNAALYKDYLTDVPGIVIPNEPDWSKGVYHLYVVKSKIATKFKNCCQKKVSRQDCITPFHYIYRKHTNILDIKNVISGN